MLPQNNFRKVTLNTPRLTLREFEDADLAAVHDYAQDPETTKYLDWGPNTLKDTTIFLNESLGFQKERPRNTFDMAVIADADKRLVGACSVTVIDTKKKIAALGYVINRKYWGNGYASESAAALIKFAFEKLGIEKVVATCDALNVGSEKVMQNVGMKQESKLAKHKFIKGKYRDELLYGIDKTAWTAHLAANASR